MGTRQFLSLTQLEDMINDPNFFDEDEPDAVVDIVELPPDNVDVVSDLEDFDEDVLEDTRPRDVPGRVEVHSCAIPIASTSSGCHTASTSTQSDETIPPTKRQKKIRSSTDWQRTSADFAKEMGQDNEILEMRENLKTTLAGKSPVEVFESLWNEDVMDYIVKQSVIYAVQNNRHHFTFSVDCLKKFIGFLLLTGYHSLPQEHMYWCEDEDVCIESVRKCLTKNRYIEIKRNLHFNDNSEIGVQKTTKSFKISPLITKMNKQFKKFGVFSKNLSIDEQMIRYYGHHYLKQFIRGKPIRFGFKEWAMCCSETGYCFHVRRKAS